MRILFLSSWFPHPPDNGSKLRVFYLLRALAVQHVVTLVSFAFDTAAPEQAQNLREICAAVHVIMLNPIERNQAGSLRRFMSFDPVSAHALPEMTQLTGRILADRPFDAVVASTLTMMRYALHAPRDVTRVLENHNSLSRWMKERFHAQTNFAQRIRCWVSWQKARRFEGRTFRQFDLVTMVSEQDAQAACDALGRVHERVAVVPNGVDCSYNRPGLVQPLPATLIFNGALTYEANLDAMHYFLTEVYPLVKQQCPQVKLTITGSSAAVRLDSLPMDSSVQLTGFVDDIRPVVSSASVCVAPIRQGGGTRLKILEAMALGTPVVATSKAVEGLDALPGEHILIGNDPATFARHTLALLNDPQLGLGIAAKARRLVEQRYDWADIGNRFVHLVEAVASQRRVG